MAEPYQTFDRQQRVTDDTGRATPYFEDYLYEITVLLGTGTPENTVSADPGRLYVDQNGSSGSTLYVKQSGTGNTGWIQV